VSPLGSHVSSGTAPLDAPESFELLDRLSLEQKDLEQKLRDSERHFQSWFHDAPVACHEVDRDGIILCVNPAECDLFGFTEQEMVGRPIWDFMSSEDREKTRIGLLARIADERPLVPLEREYKRRDGSSVIMEIHQKRVRDASGHPTGLRTFLLDITQRKRAEATLVEQADKLARSNAELEQFAYVASHDLQEPLRKIQAFGDRLKTKYEAGLGPEGLDYLARMQNAAARMQILIQDLLSLSRVATNPKPFTQVDLNDVVRTVVSDLEMRIQDCGGRVEIASLPMIAGDRGQMAQLFQNLIGNGLKFRKPGQNPVVKIQSEAQKLASGEALWWITVEDNGIGFDEKYRDRIFQIFQRLHGRNEYEGTGIGLAICRKIVERHRGTITASSTPGSGAKFLITLPRETLGENQHE
jgi:PAS domain S-box-containing protein